MSEVILNQILIELKGIKDEQIASNQRIGGLNKRIDRLDKRVETMDKRIDSLDEHFGIIDQRVDGLDKRIGGMDENIQELNNKIGVMDGHIDVIDNRLYSIDNTVNLINDQTVKLTEYYTNTMSALKGLATKEDVDYLIDKVSEHDREIYKLKNSHKDQTSN